MVNCPNCGANLVKCEDCEELVVFDPNAEEQLCEPCREDRAYDCEGS